MGNKTAYHTHNCGELGFLPVDKAAAAMLKALAAGRNAPPSESRRRREP